MPPVDQHGPTVDYSHLVPTLLKFSELAASKALKEKEKAALQDEGASIKKRLEKARSAPCFPLVTENIQAENAFFLSKLRVLQQNIDDDEKTRQNMAESLRGFLRQMPVSIPTSTSTPTSAAGGVGDNEKIAKLEAENQEMKAELRELKELILQRNPGIPTGIHAQLSKLENSVNSQSLNNHGTSKRIRKLEEWKERVEQGAIKSYPHAPEGGLSQAPDLEPLRQDVKTAHGKAAEAQRKAEAMGDRMLALQREFQSLKQSTDENTPSRQQVEKTITLADQFLQQVPDVQRRLEAIEKERLELKGAVATVGEAKAKLQDLDTRYTTLTDRYNGRILHLESMVRQFGASEKSASSSELTQQNEALAGFKDSIGKLESSHRSLWNNVNKLILDMPPVVESTKQVQKCLSATDSLVTAVRSLELRYSNINSEHLVKNMAAAMMEMYPSMSQAQDQIKSLDSYCHREIDALKAATKNADLASMDSKMSELREEVAKKLHHLQTSILDQAKSLAEQLEDTWELKNKFQTQSDAFSELGESIPQALHLVERVNELSTKLEALFGDIGTLRANLEGRDVTETVTGLSKQLETLSGNVDSLKVKQSAQDNVEKVNEISEHLTALIASYQLLDTRLKTQESAGREEVDELKACHGDLLEELKSVKIRLESQDGSEKMANLSEQLKTLSGDLSSLQTKFDEDLASLKARVDGLGHSEELSRLKSEMLARIEKFQAAVQSGLNRTSATGDDADNRAITKQRGISGSNGDHYRILGSATRNQTERGHAQNRSSSHPAGDGPIATADSSGPYFDAVSEHAYDSEDDPQSSQSSSRETPSDESGTRPRHPTATPDLPMKYRISENENGHHDSRSVNRRSVNDFALLSNSDDQLSPQPATTEIPIAYRITENENGHTETRPSRKRPRQGTFSDDGRRPRPVAPGRLRSSAGPLNGADLAVSKKAKKKQEKRERKEQRKKQKQSSST